MWTEITLNSPQRDLFAVTNINVTQVSVEKCFEITGMSAQEKWNRTHSDLMLWLINKKDAQLFLYDDGELHLLLGFKWSTWQNCIKLSYLMSDTIQTIDKLKRVIKIGADKTKEYMEYKKCYKMHQTQWFGEDYDEDGKRIPHTAKAIRYFHRVLYSELEKHGFKHIEDNELKLNWLYWQERMVGDPISL